MDGLTTTCSAGRCFRLLSPPYTSSRRHAHHFSFSRRRSFHLTVFSSSDGSQPELDRWDQMELKFGKLLGEDPKLTMAKIMGRKANPNASYLDIEKSFMKKKGKAEVVEIPLDWAVRDRNVEEQPQPSSSSMDLRAPTRTKKNSGEPKLNLVRPGGKRGGIDKKVDEAMAEVVAPQLNRPLEKVSTERVSPSVALRKPAPLLDDDFESEKPARLKIRPNLSLKMRKSTGSESLSDVNLLRKPEVVKISLEATPAAPTGVEMNNEEAKTANKMTGSGGSVASMENTVETEVEGSSESDITSVTKSSTMHDGIDQFGPGPGEEESDHSESSDLDSVQNHETFTLSDSLQGKPQRFDSVTKEISSSVGVKMLSPNEAVHSDDVEGNIISAEQEEIEDNDWRRAEELLQTGEREVVELISCSSRGFVVSFGSLIGFLPYRNLGAKWKFLAFESWLRKKGLDPSLYRQNSSIVGNYAVQNKDLSSASDGKPDMNKNNEGGLASDMKFEDLLEIYDQEKTKFLSSFIGQRTRVSVVMVDRSSRRLLFSGRRKEKEDVVERKRILMAKLSIGDIVKCCIKKITYFGIFVEIEGVPALIHQSEVSWDAALDPTSLFKIGQVVDAKVHQLDYALERITLSLKEITPDPLNEALESVVGERTPLGASIEAPQGDVEWADVESLIKELEQIDGVLNVSKGRFFFSPGLAPTFQVYMASMYENRYKLLARYENKVQEVIVQASLDKDQMKAAILTCTNRVE